MTKKRILSALLAITLVLSSLIPLSVSAESYSDAESKASFIADALVTHFGVISIQYALIDNGEITISGVAVSPNIPGLEVTAETMYGIGSLSKTYTAAAVMLLVDEGKIGLDVPVVNYIPEFTMADSRYADITVRHLLNHSSGMHGTTAAGMFMMNGWDPGVNERFLELLRMQTLKADPGAFSVYCNDGFTLASIVVERVSGMDFTAFLHENIFTPTGALNSGTPADGFAHEAFAARFFNNRPAPMEYINHIGTGGIFSTARDVVMFAAAFMDDDSGLLTRESIDAMAAHEFARGIWPELHDNVIDYGLGWDSVRLFPFNRYDIVALSKGGDTLMYNSSLVVLPEYNMAMAVLMSGGSSAFAGLMASGVLLQNLLDKGEIEELLPEVVFEFDMDNPLPIPDGFERYYGLYVTMGGAIYITANDDNTGINLTSPLTPEFSRAGLHVGDGWFFFRETNSILTFVEESNGKIYTWERSYTSIPFLGQIATNMYTAQKIEVGELDEATAEAWSARDGRIYLLVSEVYGSLVYLLGGEGAVALTARYDPEMGDVYAGNRITGENTAVNIRQIPGMHGRDTSNFAFGMINGFEYFYVSGFMFVDIAAYYPIHAGERSVATIGEAGHNRWFLAGEAAGKTLTVEVPENAAFAVYDADFANVSHSFIDGGSAVLPEGGFIVFIGEPGARFEITMSTSSEEKTD